MKKILFIVTMVALVIGTAVDASAKVKKTKKKVAKTTQVAKPSQVTAHGNKMNIDQGMYTAEGATRLSNGDVANLEQAYLTNFLMEYVFTGNLVKDSYFRYVKLKFTDEALEMLKNGEDGYDWTIITGKRNGNEGINPSNYSMKELTPGQFLVEGGGHKCVFVVSGKDGAYKISSVKAE